MLFFLSYCYSLPKRPDVIHNSQHYKVLTYLHNMHSIYSYIQYTYSMTHETSLLCRNPTAPRAHRMTLRRRMPELPLP